MSTQHYSQVYPQQSHMDPVVQQCQQAFEQALGTYEASNMFEYEKVCKQIFMKSLLNANASTKQETRL